MKKILSILFGLLVFPVFAEVAPVYYDMDVEEYIDEEYTDEDVDIVEEQTQPAKATTKKATVQRSVSRGTNTSNTKVTTRGSSANSRAVASTRGNATVSNRSAVNRTTKKVSSRTPTTTSRTKVTSRTASNNRPTVARIGTTGSVMGGVKATTGSAQQTLTTNNSSLYNATKIGSGIRASTQRFGAVRAATATATNVTNSDISSTTTNMENLTELTEYCKAQYASCMDDYCNVLDENQGRCSCSKNIKNYEKTEASLAEATETLQQVVQQIKYIGLTTAQVETLFTETEAELTLSGYKSDTTTLAKSLDSIKKNILDVSTPKASNTTSNLSMSNGLFDFDLGSGFDISSFLGTTNSTNNVSNQRGETLYKTASQRCKTSVLNTCTSQGVDANLITNSYDLEIDKHCIAYEKSLKTAIDDVKTNVSNATVVLQQARLMLSQNKNAYGLRDCVSALDTCMQDELICGDEYEFCLDPTGKYVNEGNIILGSTPGIAGGYVKNQTLITDSTNWVSDGMTELYSVWNYTNNSKNKNAWGDGAQETIAEYIDIKLVDWASAPTETKATTDMATYLLRKIGYIEIDNKKAEKVHGLCANVFQQCQDYTFETKNSGKNISKKYIYDNDVVKQYLAMVLPRIRAKQDTLLSEYAEDCMSDVESCLSTNGYDNEKPTSTKSKTAVSSCRSYISTCMSVSGYKPSDVRNLTSDLMINWVSMSQSGITNCPDGYIVDSLKNTCVKVSDVIGNIDYTDLIFSHVDSSHLSWYDLVGNDEALHPLYGEKVTHKYGDIGLNNNTRGFFGAKLEPTNSNDINNFIVSGIAKCSTTQHSEDGIVKNSITDTNGMYCWCGVDSIHVDSNPTLNIDSLWISIAAKDGAGANASITECKESCAAACAHNIRGQISKIIEYISTK